MIRIHRGPEPPGLALTRRSRLALAMDAYASHGGGSRELTATLVEYGSRATKMALFVAQNKKCAWCERRRDLSSSPVEHYRPKDGAWRHLPDQPSQVERTHYWWLCWTWENLLFSCARCNDQGHKANYFPLAAGTAAMSTPPRPVPTPYAPQLFDGSIERPCLLDPSDPTIDPMDHIEWRPAQTHQPRKLWLWSPHGRTEEGRATIAILKLAELADEVADELQRCVLPSIEEVYGHLANNRRDAAQRRWRTLLQNTLSAGSPLSAAVYNALAYYVPPATRIIHGLLDPPRPGTAPTT